jgi:biopolymer transport protein ExbD
MNPSVNAGSMADIAFLLLIFFLVSTEIMNEKGIPIILPPYTEETGLTITSNLFSIWINKENELLVDKVEMDISQLKTATKQFIYKSSEKSSSLIVSINSDENTAFETYVQVYAELKQAYIEIWENESQKLFNKELTTLSREEFENIKKKYPLRISEVEKYNI